MNYLILALIINGALIGIYYIVMHFWYAKVWELFFKLKLERRKIGSKYWNKGKQRGERIAQTLIGSVEKKEK